MNPFEKKFMTMIEEELPVVDDPAAVGAELATDPVGGVEELGGEPDFDATIDSVDDVEDNPGVNWRKDQNDNQRGTIQGWVAKVGSFMSFLNGNVPDSIQKQLAAADCDTLFNDVSNNQAKKITRIAADLGALQQELQGYLIKADEE